MYNTLEKPKQARVSPLRATEKGQKKLGRLLREFRKETMGMSLRLAADYITERTGYPFSFTTLSGIERGAGKADADTLLLFVQAEWGGMSFNEMYSILTDGRLAACEKPSVYKTKKAPKKAIAV
jgi:hypothetical protein